MRTCLLTIFAFCHLVVSAWAQPANDAFANALQLDSLTTNIQSSLDGASNEAGEPALSGGGPFASVWWTWMPATNVSIALFTSDNDDSKTGEYSRLVEVFRGEDAAHLQLLGRQNDYRLPLVFAALGGQQYRIRVAAPPDAAGPFTFHAAGPPANDSFSNKSTLSGVFDRATLLNSLATREPDERLPVPTALGRSAWYRWTAPADGRLLLIGEATDWEPTVTLASGSSLKSLQFLSVVESDAVWRGGIARRFEVKAGIEYSIMLDGSRYSTDAGRPIQDYHGLCRLTASFSSLRFAQPLDGSRIKEGLAVPVKLESLIPSIEVPFRDLKLHLRRVGWTEAFDADLSADTLMGMTPALTPGTFVAYADGTNLRDVYHETPLVRLFVYPTNDQFSERTAISPEAGIVFGSMSQTTLEPGESPFWPAGTTGSGWWSFVAAHSGIYRVQCSAMKVAVFSGDTVQTLRRISGAPALTQTFSATAGATYHLGGTVSANLENLGNVSLELIAPLINDSLSKAPTLSVTNGSTSFWTHDEGATREPGEPIHTAADGSATVWWRWTSPSAGSLAIDAARRDGLSQCLALYRGTGLSTLGFPVATAFPPTSTLVAEIEAGATYSLVVVRPFNSPASPFRVTTVFRARPPNDRFQERIKLAGNQITFGGPADNSTVETAEPSPLGGSIWWAWTPTEAGLLRIGGFGNNEVTVFVGSSLDTLQELSSVNYDLGGGGWKDYLPPANQPLAIRFSSNAQLVASVALQLSFRSTPAAPNDSFSKRIRLLGNSLVHDLPLQRISEEPGEPDFRIVANGPDAGSRWFEWRAESAGRVQFITSAPGLLRVYRTTGQEPSLTNLTAASGFHSAVVGDVTAGELLCIGIYSRIPSDGNLQVRSLAIPANGNYRGAVELKSPPFRLVSSAAGEFAGLPKEPFWNISSVWYRWTPEDFGDVQFDREDIPGLQVYLGDPPQGPIDLGRPIRFAVSPHQRVWFKLLSGVTEEPWTAEGHFAPVHITTGIRLLPARQIELRARGPSGRQLRVDTSNNLKTWTHFGHIPLQGDQVSVQTNVTTSSVLYYRFRLER